MPYSQVRPYHRGCEPTFLTSLLGVVFINGMAPNGEPASVSASPSFVRQPPHVTKITARTGVIPLIPLAAGLITPSKRN